MKKITLLLLSLLMVSVYSGAKPVTTSVAQIVASNFYGQYTNTIVKSSTLFYTEKSNSGEALYYVYNVNAGFVIVSADDACSPVLGYSTEGNYVIPQKGTNVYYWMQNRKSEISALKTNLRTASPEVSDLWNSYQNNKKPHSAKALMSVAPLCQTTWDQPYPYNAMCPGGSVTGCVATAMAQVIKYWNYPAHGLGSSYYYEYSPGNYGLLKADYDTSNYAWAAMPNKASSLNNGIAKLMYDCGVSVDMSYSPSESGAWVIASDNPICAQNSYVKYFGFNAKTIQGLKRKKYSDSAWIALIENELNNGRVTEYAGWDTVNGGHTWVCDGYDVNNNLHMNWGWSGYDNGYYDIDTLDASPYNFSSNHEIVVGIQPPPVLAAFDASPLTSCAGTTVSFTDKSLVPSLFSPITSRTWIFPGGNPATSTSANPNVVYNTPGVYPVTLIVSNISGIDTITKTAYINIDGPNTLPFVQQFEGTFPPTQWAVLNPWSHATSWAEYNGTGGYGNSTHCMYFNNCSGGKLGQTDRINTPSYDFSSVSNPFIYFDVAYAPYNNIYSDTLALYYSLDCGNTYTRVYLKGGMSLCTTGGVTVIQGANSDMNGCFVPMANNWRTDTVSIPAIAGQSTVMFAFENRSGNGSNIFVDNVNVAIPTSINNLADNNKLEVYPNPTSGLVNISFNTLPGSIYMVSVYNELGQEVANKTVQYSAGNYVYQMNLSELGKGVYSVIVRDGKTQMIQKVALY